MTADGFPTTAEIKQLEAEADALLKADAQAGGFIRSNGRGFSAYARAYGITTKKILETVFAHEKIGFTEWQMDQLAARSKDNIDHENGETEEG